MEASGWPCTKRFLFKVSFPYVCPEPILVKDRFSITKGSQKGVLRTCGDRSHPHKMKTPPRHSLQRETRWLFLSSCTSLTRVSRACLGKRSLFIHQKYASNPSVVSRTAIRVGGPAGAVPARSHNHGPHSFIKYIFNIHIIYVFHIKYIHGSVSRLS